MKHLYKECILKKEVNNQVEDGRNLPWQVLASLVPEPQESGNQAAKYSDLFPDPQLQVSLVPAL